MHYAEGTILSILALVIRLQRNKHQGAVLLVGAVNHAIAVNLSNIFYGQIGAEQR